MGILETIIILLILFWLFGLLLHLAGAFIHILLILAIILLLARFIRHS